MAPRSPLPTPAVEPAGRLLLDYSDSGWLAGDYSGPPRVIARSGVLAKWISDAWRFYPAPFHSATSACWDKDELWVASSAGRLWHFAWGKWSWQLCPPLGSERGRLLAYAGRVWLIGRKLFAIEDGSLRVELDTELFGLRLLHGADSLIAYNEQQVCCFGTRFTSVLRAAELPSPGSAILAVELDGKGGVWIVDNAGALLHYTAGSIRVVRSGRITCWERRVYPDPDPDRYDDAVRVAAVSRAGTVATWRYYDYGREESYGSFAVIARDGTVLQREVRDNPGNLGFYASGELAEWAPRPSLSLGMVPPQPLITDFRQGQVALEIGSERLWIPLPGTAPCDPDAQVEGTDGPIGFAEETWSIRDGTLNIAAYGSAVDVPLPARLFTLLARRQGPPLVVDTQGTHYVFSGAAWVLQALGLPIGELIAAKVDGEVLRVASARYVAEVPIAAPPPLEPFAASADPSYLRSQLPAAIGECQVLVLPSVRADVLPALSSSIRQGRTNAGLALAQLWFGTPTRPRAQDDATLAARLMGALDGDTIFLSLTDGKSLVLWAAVLSHATILTFKNSYASQFLSTNDYVRHAAIAALGTMVVGSTRVSLRTPDSESFDSDGTDGPIGVAEEIWSLRSGTLNIAAYGSAVDVPLPARLFTLLARRQESPLVVDAQGTHYVFSGAAWVTQALGVPIGELVAAKVAGEVLRVASARYVAEVPIAAPPPLEPFAASAEPSYLRSQLPDSYYGCAMHILPISRLAVLPTLQAWMRQGRTNAGLTLAELWFGKPTGPLVPDHALPAARLLRALADDASFSTLTVDGSLIAWIAVLADYTMVVLKRSFAARVLDSLSSQRQPVIHGE